MLSIDFPSVARPKVSVLMVTYGGWDFVSKALESLLANTDPCYELVIVDNASPDGTDRRILEEVGNARIALNKVNRGFGPANNQAASLARSPYLLLLNSDCFVRPGWLPPLLANLDNDAAVAAAAPMFLHPGGRLQEAGSVLYRNCRGQAVGDGDDAGKDEYRFSRGVDYVSAACFLIRRRAFLDAGGFDMLFHPAYFEDTDLCLRLGQKGWRIRFEPRSVVTHIRGASSSAAGARTLYERSHASLAWRWSRFLASRPPFTPLDGDRPMRTMARDYLVPARLLVVSECLPCRGLETGGAAAFRMLGELAAGWPDCRITLLTPATPTDPALVEDLLARGVEVAAGIGDLATWLEERRFHFDVVLLGGVRIPAMLAEPLRKSQPQATVVPDAPRLVDDRLAGVLTEAGIAPPLRAATLDFIPRAGARPDTAAGKVHARAAALLILGMQRSGTSALAGCLHLLGVPFGEPLMAADHHNEAGYFELLDVVTIHDEMLTEFGGSSLDLSSLSAGWLDEKPARRAQERLRRIFRHHFAGHRLWAVKHPGLSVLLPLWMPLLDELGVEPRCTIVLRSPWEVVRSLEVRNGLAPTESLELWLRHLVEAERSTRRLRRTFVAYDKLLVAPESELDRLSKSLGLEWPRQLCEAAAAIQRFLRPSLRHWGRAAAPADLPADLVMAVRAFEETLLAGAEREGNVKPQNVEKCGETCRRFLARIRAESLAIPGSENEYGLEWVRVAVPAEMKRGEWRPVGGLLHHIGADPLSKRDLAISYHWLDADDPVQSIVTEGIRTPVARVLRPGQFYESRIAVQAPAKPGRYLLALDVVRENVTWFVDKGMPSPSFMVRVV